MIYVLVQHMADHPVNRESNMPDWKQAIRERLAPANLDAAPENDVVEELAQHLDDRYQELQAKGITDEECRALASAELDGLDLLSAAVRLPRRPSASGPALGFPNYKRGYVGAPMHDLKTAFRNLRTQPWFSLMVIGMLALGIAGNAAIFSIFNGLFLRSLPFEESNRLIELDETAPKWNLKYVGVSNPDFCEWRKSNSVDGSAQRVEGAQVTRDMLDVLRLKPMIGRDFRPEEDKPGGAKVVLLNYGIWQRMFRGDSNV
jgi:hypothetical protein